MRIMKASYEIMTNIEPETILETIERAGRMCYKSEGKITDFENTKKFVRGLIKRKHFAMIEHGHITVKFIIDRGVSHEMVRHRIASFAQESTRYCNYYDGETILNTEPGAVGGLNVIEPSFFIGEGKLAKFNVWLQAMVDAEASYNRLIEYGAKPEEARSVLPNSLKTEIVVTMNLREWRHFFELRALGLTGRPHPQMVEVAKPLLFEMSMRIPVIFDDLIAQCNPDIVSVTVEKTLSITPPNPMPELTMIDGLDRNMMISEAQPTATDSNNTDGV